MNNIKNSGQTKSRTVKIYGTPSWYEFRGVPKSRGINTSTHLAKIADETGKLHDCYVKLLDINSPSLLGEAIGWILADSNLVPCAQFACIVLVPTEALAKFMALPEWAKNLETCPAWCTEIVNGKSLAQLHKWEYWLYRKSCLKSKDVSAIAAMDCWADNKDRNSGNVMRTNTGRYIAIDHETLLHDLLWVPYGRTFVEQSLMGFAKQELSISELNQFCIDMAVAGNQHEQGYKLAFDAINEITINIYDLAENELLPMIHNFIEPRSKAGWLSNKLGVIV